MSRPQADPSASPTPIAAGTLRAAVRARSASAIASGALEPVETSVHVLAGPGMTFQVRVLAGLRRKLAASAGRPDPFDPPEAELLVGSLGEDHLCVLNKFRVLPDHLLVVTREYEDQEQLLTPADMEAVLRCLSEIDGLVFYNAGREAGASQPHKHAQMIPLPLDEGPLGVPIGPLLEPLVAAGDTRITRLAGLPFDHACCCPGHGEWCREAGAASRLHDQYRELLRACGIGSGPGGRQTLAYNWLLTRRWTLAVPRTAGKLAGVPVNALGYAGALLALDRQGLEAIRRTGPMELLKAAAASRPGPRLNAR